MTQLNASQCNFRQRTRVQVKGILLRVLEQNLRLRQNCEHLFQQVLRNARICLNLVKRERVIVVVLDQHRHLERACDEDVLLARKVRLELILAVVPQPRKFAPGVSLLVVLLEAVVRRHNVFRDDESHIHWLEWPEVSAQYLDRKGHVRVLRERAGHPLPELIREIFAQTHVYIAESDKCKIRYKVTYR